MYDEATITVDDHYTLQVHSRTGYGYSGATPKQWWLLRDGTPVAFVSTLTFTDGRQAGCDFQLCDIEVRPEYRRQGLTHTLIEAVEKIEGMPIWTSGGFTPLGAEALGWLRVKPWEEPGVKYRDMTFVNDWNTMRPEFPL
jgi:GNAT superfamily N-acetyltransferase